MPFTTTIAGFELTGRIYEKPSRFGINGSRVGRLQVSDARTGKIVLRYDQGYDLCEVTSFAQSFFVKYLEREF